jgi:hypothetical protein
MPTVPGGEEEENDETSIAAQRPAPKIGWGDMSFPIGQISAGAYGDKQWREFRSLRTEVWKQTIEAQNPDVAIGQAVGSKLGPGWERMIKEGPKSKNIEYAPRIDDPTKTEEAFVRFDARKAQLEWMKSVKPGQNVLGLPGPSDPAEALYGKKKRRE